MNVRRTLCASALLLALPLGAMAQSSPLLLNSFLAPQHPVTDEHVEIDPAAKLTASEPATLLLHKPEGVAWQDAAALAVPAGVGRIA